MAVGAVDGMGGSGSAWVPTLWQGEQLLWTGRPRPGIHLQPGDGFRLPFMAAWLSFALFWELGVIAARIRPFAVFGAFFVAIGVWGLFGPYLIAGRRARTTRYAVTDRRVISQSTTGSGFELPTAGLRVSVHRRRSAGTVLFGDPVPAFSGFAAAATRTNALAFGLQGMSEPAFADVADFEALMAALDRARAAANATAAAPLPPPPPGPSHPPGPLPRGPIS